LVINNCKGELYSTEGAGIYFKIVEKRGIKLSSKESGENPDKPERAEV